MEKGDFTAITLVFATRIEIHLVKMETKKKKSKTEIDVWVQLVNSFVEHIFRYEISFIHFV